VNAINWTGHLGPRLALQGVGVEEVLVDASSTTGASNVRVRDGNLHAVGLGVRRGRRDRRCRRRQNDIDSAVRSCSLGGSAAVVCSQVEEVIDSARHRASRVTRGHSV